MFLGIDAGGSATRWAVSDAAGQIVARGETAAMSGHLFDDAARARMVLAAAELALAVGMRIDGVTAGITGLSAEAPLADLARAILVTALGVPAEKILIRDDLWIAYHGTFRPGAGHVVYAGSGSIGMHLRADGTVVRVGGRGMLIDDGGSAFAIARAALNHVWRARDADPGFLSPLAQALDTATGGHNWDTVRAHVYGGGRNAMAQLARAVAAADDPVARNILRAAGADLARLALALVAREGSRPVALLGRAARLHPAIAAGFRRAAPGLDMRLVTIDAAAAAARLAADADAVQAAYLDTSEGR